MSDERRNEEGRLAERFEEARPQRAEISDGWWPLVLRLDNRLAALNPRYRLRRIRRVDGRLLIDATQDIPALEAAFQATLRFAEAEAVQTCEQCGRPGLMRNLSAASATLCEEHLELSKTESARFTNAGPWAAVIGQCYTRESIARALGTSLQEVDEAADELRLLSFTSSDGVQLFPALQVRSGQAPDGLEYVLRVLHAGFDSPLMWAQWLTHAPPSPPARPAWRRIDMLHAGHLQEVLLDAQHTATAWASDPESAAAKISLILAELEHSLPENAPGTRLHSAIDEAERALLNLSAFPVIERDAAFSSSQLRFLEAVLGELLAALADADSTDAARVTEATDE
ncbi:hypothetical protein [Microbacterium sp. zg.Y1084]|uniref:hypothetical protein n=1 Tax=Microbacterium sp. zg.Y1084 TaxID=2969667 RepID=UPI00214C1AAA|nr:hypothetical protein [Microbacterium sp. zg.Y1084]MCR2813034.1 hypothetical protein [Microbacterium sp. zg.Y1084]